MISWLIDQTLLISVFTLFYLFSKPIFNRYIGASGVYATWLAIPVVISLSMLPIPQSDVLPTYSLVVEAKQASSLISKQWIDFHSVVLLMWGCVFFILLCTLLVQHRRYLTSLELSPSLIAFSGRLNRIGNLSSLKVFSSAKINSPFVVGVVRPKLVLPAGFNDKFNPLQKRLILEHESIHVKRGDLLWNALATFILLVFWFNPLSWIAFKLFRQSQEMACDQNVVKDLNDAERKTYAAAMLDCALAGPGLNLTVLNYGAKKLMKERIASVKTHQKNRHLRSIVAVTLAMSALLSVSVVGAKKHEEAGPGIEQPLTRIEPHYPVEAARQGLEGSVILSFDINTDGSVSNAKVIEEQPENVFGRNAIVAVEQWTYKPLNKKQTGMLVQLDFKMDEDSGQKAALEMSQDREVIAVVN